MRGYCDNAARPRSPWDGRSLRCAGCRPGVGPSWAGGARPRAACLPVVSLILADRMDSSTISALAAAYAAAAGRMWSALSRNNMDIPWWGLAGSLGGALIGGSVVLGAQWRQRLHASRCACRALLVEIDANLLALGRLRDGPFSAMAASGGPLLQPTDHVFRVVLTSVVAVLKRSEVGVLMNAYGERLIGARVTMHVFTKSLTAAPGRVPYVWEERENLSISAATKAFEELQDIIVHHAWPPRRWWNPWTWWRGAQSRGESPPATEP
jgi:hypothetical protein